MFNKVNDVTTKVYIQAKNQVLDFIEDEGGVTAVEYAVIAVAMSAILLAVFKEGTMKTMLTNVMTKIGSNLTAAGTK